MSGFGIIFATALILWVSDCWFDKFFAAYERRTNVLAKRDR